MVGGASGFGLLRFDLNNDGKVTRGEVLAAEKTRFAEADADKDGFVTPEEIRTAMTQRMIKARFASLDTDHNGQISMAEFEKAHLEGRGIDRNLGPRPGGPAFEARHERNGAGQHRHRGPGGQHRADVAGVAPGASSDAAPDVRRMGPGDANADGKLSLDEFSARSLAVFDRADTDKNGTVTIAELRAASGLTK